MKNQIMILILLCCLIPPKSKTLGSFSKGDRFELLLTSYCLVTWELLPLSGPQFLHL